MFKKYVPVLAISCVIVMVLAIGIFLAMPKHQQNAANGPNFTWSLGSDVTQTQLNNVDVRPAIYSAGATFWEVYSDGSNVVHRLQCTTLDACTAQANGTLDSSFGTPYGEHYWLGGGVVNGSTWYATVHVEFAYHSTPAANFNWFRKIGIADSTNNGATWHYLGDAVFSDQSTNIHDFAAYRYFQAGPGDQYLLSDTNSGYNYLFYTTFWADQNTSERWEGTRVARSLISANLAPGSWTKWYNGSWSQPGVGGKDSDIFLNQDNAVVAWDSYLGSYVAIGHDTFGHTFIATASDLGQENWTARYTFTSDTTQLQWYNWGVDATTANPAVWGQTIRLYSSQNDFNGVSSNYKTVTFGSGTQNATLQAVLQYQYPYQSLPDFNAGWTRSPDEPYGTVINAGFENDPNIPSGWTQYPAQWSSSSNVHIVTSGQHSGTQAVTEDATSAAQSLEQYVDVVPGNTYTYCAWARSNDGSAIYIGVKNFGGTETNVPVTSGSYTQACVQFTVGLTSYAADLYAWHPSGGLVYLDDVTLTAGG